jgi:hypothetical protein
MASRSIARADPIAPVRGMARVAALVAALCAYVPLHFVTLALRRRSHWPRRFLARVARICGADVQVRGAPLTGDVLFVSNHSSWLDIPIIAGATGTAFVANSGIRSWPLVGWLASLNNTVFVDRGDRADLAVHAGTSRSRSSRKEPLRASCCRSSRRCWRWSRRRRARSASSRSASTIAPRSRSPGSTMNLRRPISGACSPIAAFRSGWTVLSRSTRPRSATARRSLPRRGRAS